VAGIYNEVISRESFYLLSLPKFTRKRTTPETADYFSQSATTTTTTTAAGTTLFCSQMPPAQNRIQ